MAVPDEQGAQRPPRRLALFFWSLGAIVVWFSAWVIYQGQAELGDGCFGGLHGGRTRSEGWAALLGLLLFLVAAILALRWRRRLLLLLAAFATVYIACLLALWWLSPTIWGHELCD
jgi:hypothetical protein